MYRDIDLQGLHMKDISVNITRSSQISGTLKFYYPNQGDIVWYVNCYGEDFGQSANVNFISSEVINIESKHIYLYKE